MKACARMVPFIALAPDDAKGFAAIDRMGFRRCGVSLVGGHCESCDDKFPAVGSKQGAGVILAPDAPVPGEAKESRG